MRLLPAGGSLGITTKAPCVLVSVSMPTAQSRFNAEESPAHTDAASALAGHWSRPRQLEKKAKTFDNRNSLMVTHSTTNLPSQCLTSVSEREPVLSLYFGRMRIE
jgi:hypothetical protein